MTDDTFIANLIDEAVELHTTIATLESQLSAEQKQKIAALVLAFIVGLLNVFGINVPIIQPCVPSGSSILRHSL